jgi:homoserine kinase
VLGLAVTGAGDTVVARRSATPGIQLTDPGHPDLPADPERHAAGIAAQVVLDWVGANGVGVALEVRKGLPLAGGQGGSAASAAASAGAVNALLGGALDPLRVIEAALEAEATVAGRHADNVAAAVLGGLVLVRSLQPLECVRLPLPEGLHLVLAHPRMSLRTADARAVLPRAVSRSLAMHQAAQVGAIVASAALGDLGLLGRALDDRLAEPARVPLLPGFRQAKRAALHAGALGCSISGSGPTAFAVAADATTAQHVADAMRAAYAEVGLAATTRVAPPDLVGLRIEAE